VGKIFLLAAPVRFETKPRRIFVDISDIGRAAMKEERLYKIVAKV